MLGPLTTLARLSWLTGWRMEGRFQQRCTIVRCKSLAKPGVREWEQQRHMAKGISKGIGAMCGLSVIYFPQLSRPLVCRKTESQFQTRTDQSRGIQIKAEIKKFQQVCRDQGSKWKASPKAQLLGTPSSGTSSSVPQQTESRAAPHFRGSLLNQYLFRKQTHF